MFATIEHRATNVASLDETGQRAARDFFPAIERAAGFRGFYVVAQEDGHNVAIALWESQADADAFGATYATWQATLEELGHRRTSDHHGEVFVQIAPRPQ